MNGVVGRTVELGHIRVLVLMAISITPISDIAIPEITKSAISVQE